MIESVVMSAVVVLFKAAFAGEDLDRKVGAQVIGTVIDGLLRTTSASDPVLHQIHRELKQLATAPYDQAMAAGHRYLEEARVASGARHERLKLAREQLVNAASAAEGLKVPLLTANAEFAIAKCDVLLGSPEHAEMALRRASAAIEAAIEALDVSASAWRNLRDAKYKQDESVGKWLERLTSGSGLVRQAEIAATESSARDALASLVVLTDLYSQVQTAILATAGLEHTVMWGPPADQNIEHGLRDKAVVSATAGRAVSGFGLTLTVERQALWQPEGRLSADLLVRVTAREDRWVYCRAQIALGAPAMLTRDAATIRASDSVPWLVNPPGAMSFTISKGSYRGWLRVPAESASLDTVNLRVSRLVDGRRISTGACIRIPVVA